MALHESIRGLVNLRGNRRPPLVGLDFLHDSAARARRMAVSRQRFQARDLFSLLLRHFAARRSAPEPRCRILLNAVGPSGIPTVRILGQKRAGAPADMTRAPSRPAKAPRAI